MPAENGEKFVSAMDKLLCGLERDSETSVSELESVRKTVMNEIKAAQNAALDRMATGRVGRSRVLLPTRANISAANLASTRVRERFSSFRLQWLNQENLQQKIQAGWTRAQQNEFHRHSNRLARNAKSFLQEIGELEPSLQDEVAATIAQLEDARNDLLKLEVRSWTRAQETLGRSVNGRLTRVAAGDAIRTFDMDRNLWNLSLLEHPKAVTRSLLADAEERMREAVSKRTSRQPKRTAFVAGVCPAGTSVSKMTPESRTAKLAWRVFTAGELTARAAKKAKQVQSVSTFRGLGESYNTREFYVPVPADNLEEVEQLMRDRRSDFLKGLKR